MGSCFLLLIFTPLESNQLTHVLIPGLGGGALPYERSWMLVVSSGCKFRPLVSLREFQAKRHYILPQRSFSGLQAKKYKKIIFSIRFIYSIYVIKVFQGSQKVGSSPVGLLQVIQNFRRASASPFVWEFPRDSDHYVRCMYYVTWCLKRYTNHKIARNKFPLKNTKFPRISAREFISNFS